MKGLIALNLWVDALDFVETDVADPFDQLVDAANGLDYMHSIHMVHGDLKGVCYNSCQMPIH